VPEAIARCNGEMVELFIAAIRYGGRNPLAKKNQLPTAG